MRKQFDFQRNCNRSSALRTLSYQDTALIWALPQSGQTVQWPYVRVETKERAASV